MTERRTIYLSSQYLIDFRNDPCLGFDILDSVYGVLIENLE